MLKLRPGRECEAANGEDGHHDVFPGDPTRTKRVPPVSGSVTHFEFLLKYKSKYYLIKSNNRWCRINRPTQNRDFQTGREARFSSCPELRKLSHFKFFLKLRQSNCYMYCLLLFTVVYTCNKCSSLCKKPNSTESIEMKLAFKVYFSNPVLENRRTRKLVVKNRENKENRSVLLSK